MVSYDSIVRSHLDRLSHIKEPGPAASPVFKAVSAWARDYAARERDALDALSRMVYGETPLEIFLGEEPFALYLRDHPEEGQPALYTVDNVRVRYDGSKERFYPGGLLQRPFPANWRSPVPSIEGPWLRVETRPAPGAQPSGRAVASILGIFPHSPELAPPYRD